MSKLAFENPDVNTLADQLEDFLVSHESTLTFFKQSASGPEVMGDNYLPFVTEDPDPYRELYRIGSFYCVAIGQGSYYHAGLFGPLPVLGSEYRAIVYSALVEDDQTFDQRMKGLSTYMGQICESAALLCSKKRNYLINCLHRHSRTDWIKWQRSRYSRFSHSLSSSVRHKARPLSSVSNFQVVSVS